MEIVALVSNITGWVMDIVMFISMAVVVGLGLSLGLLVLFALVEIVGAGARKL